jgi:hypothetical protein
VWWADGNASSGDIVVTGWLWGRKVTRVVAPDARQARSTARVLSTFVVLPAEIEAEIFDLAQAVNAVWSLFATWGGSGGYQDLDEWGYGSIGTSSFHCCSRVGTVSHTIGIGHGSMMPKTELETVLGAIVARCRPDAQVTLALETTMDEIIGVEVSGVSGAVQDCIAEGVWDTTISLAGMPAHAHSTFVFQPT